MATSPDTVIAYVSVADCTSRLLPTLRSRLYDKIRRVASAVRRTADATSSRLSQLSPRVELRLRHSALLLAGHNPGVWSVLTHTLNDAARDAGIDRITGPLVSWNVLDVCEQLEQVLPTTNRVVFRADLGHQPNPMDIRALALTLPLTGNSTAVLSARASACSNVHPDAVEVRLAGRIPVTFNQDPVLFRAATAVLVEQCHHFTSEMTASPGSGQPNGSAVGHALWLRGLPCVDLDPDQFLMAFEPRDFSWTSAGWPVTRPGTNRVFLGPTADLKSSLDADALARHLANVLSPFGNPASAYAVIDTHR